jgi:hypothetical protein
MTAEMYVAHAAAILREYETSTTERDNTNDEGEITTAREILMYEDSKSYNVSDRSNEIFSSPYDISLYQIKCTEDFAYENTIGFRDFLYEIGFLHCFEPTAQDLHETFYELLKTAIRFGCTAKETLGHDVISMSRTYVQRCKDFLSTLNRTTADRYETALYGAVGLDREVYETGMLHAQYMMELAEHLNELIIEHAKIDKINKSIDEKYNENYFLHGGLEWENIVARQEELTSLLQSCVQEAENASKYKEHDFLDILISNQTSYFLNVSHWTDLLEKSNERLDRYKTKLTEAQQVKFVLYTVETPMMATVFIVGITGNGVLLTIFIRHKEIRTFPNSMLMNLTAVDCLTLLISVLLDYFRYRSAWQLGVLMCKLFILSDYMFTAVSVYSVVTLSVQRFMTVRQLPSGAMCHVGKKTKYVLVATVWALGFILTLPHGLKADVVKAKCKEPTFGEFATSDLVVFCILPVILVAVFTGLTAARIRKSAGSIPGEGAGQERLRHRRIVSSTVLTALVALFVVSYTPYFLFTFLIFQFDISREGWQYYMFFIVTFYPRYLNCCFNPLILFVMSSSYRARVKECICCGKRRHWMEA